MFLKFDVDANLWHSAPGQKISSIHEKYVQILQPSGNIQDKFHRVRVVKYRSLTVL